MQTDELSRFRRAARELKVWLRDSTRNGFFFGAVVFTISASIALGWARVREAVGPPAAARVAVWVSDRDGDRVFGLDRDLLVVKSVVLRAPIEVEARNDGGAWVVSATQADPLGRHQLVRLAFDGAIAAQAPLGPILDLACDEQGRASVVDIEASSEQVAVFDSSGVAVWRRTWPGALCAAARGQGLLVGTQAGELDLFDLNLPTAAPLRVNWGGAVSDVSAGPTPGRWWALDSHGYCRLALLDAQLSVIWSRTVGLHALHLAPLAATERVWIADTTQPSVRRFGPGGVLEIDRSNMPLGGLDRGCSALQGAALFTAPGALLRLDAMGQNSPGQAGFDFLVDVSTVRS